MCKIAMLAFAALTCLASLSCQSYSTGLQQSIVRADETTAIAALHSIAVAQQTYSLSNNGNFGTLQQLRDAGYLDARFDSPNGGAKDYALTINTKPQSAEATPFFSCNADPTNAGPQAGRHFYVDSVTAALHVNPTQPATVSDPIYQP
jgi:Tfp pilus assembly protein PilE